MSFRQSGAFCTFDTFDSLNRISVALVALARAPQGAAATGKCGRRNAAVIECKRILTRKPERVGMRPPPPLDRMNPDLIHCFRR